MGTPQKGTPVFGKPHLESLRSSRGSLSSEELVGEDKGAALTPQKHCMIAFASFTSRENFRAMVRLGAFLVHKRLNSG